MLTACHISAGWQMLNSQLFDFFQKSIISVVQITKEISNELYATLVNKNIDDNLKLKFTWAATGYFLILTSPGKNIVAI